MLNVLKTKWIFIPTALIGLVVFIILVKNRAQPDLIPLTESAKAVHVIKVPEIDVVPLVKSSGTVNPGQVWRGIAEVSGKIIEMHPRLKKGAIIDKGEVLIKIDPTEYELAIAQAMANIATNKAQLAEIDVQQKNTSSLLEIEKNALKLSENEVNRKKKLFKDKSISRAEYDKEKKNLLNQQKNIATLKNTLALYPVQRERINAELKKLEALLASAKLNLQRATISMPFSGRISDMKIELGQFVRQGELLTVADGMKKAEITVQIPINSLSQLMRTNTKLNVGVLTSNQTSRNFGIKARVKLPLGDNIVEWQGTVVRISETLDLKTRTIGVIVEVDDPYKDILPGIKPPLMKGMFVSVELSGKPQPNSLIIPRSALSRSRVHLVTEDNRLETRKVTTGLTSNGFVVVSSGLKKDDQIIVSDLVPAIEGMLLKAINDEKSLKRLIEAASGGASQ